MCRCENCIDISYLHDALNRFRMRTQRPLEEKASLLKDEVWSTANRQAKKRIQTQYLASVLDADDFSEFVFPDGVPLQPKPRHTLDMIMCKPVVACNNLTKWKCVLGKCMNCPKAHFHPFEQSINDFIENSARFQHYRKFTKCSKHSLLDLASTKFDLCEGVVSSTTEIGNIRTRSELTLSQKRIECFITENYLPLLERYRHRYHHTHVMTLSST
jgi:hypothetical protein